MRVYEMIADLRLFARPPQPELQPVALVELVDGLIAELSPPAAQEDIALRREGDPDRFRSWPIRCNCRWRLRALCQNAIEAVGGQGRIAHRVASRAGRGGDSRPRRRARHPARAASAHFRSVLFGPAGGPRPGPGAVEVLADRHQSRRPHRGGESARRRGMFYYHAAGAVINAIIHVCRGCVSRARQ